MNRKMKVVRVGLWSAVKIGFLLSAMAGFLAGLFSAVVFALFSSLISMAFSEYNPGMGPGALIAGPLFFAGFTGVFGAVCSFFLALAYNIFAGAFGGLEVEVEMEREPSPQPPKLPGTWDDMIDEDLKRPPYRVFTSRFLPVGSRSTKRRNV